MVETLPEEERKKYLGHSEASSQGNMNIFRRYTSADDFNIDPKHYPKDGRHSLSYGTALMVSSREMIKEIAQTIVDKRASNPE